MWSRPSFHRDDAHSVGQKMEPVPVLNRSWFQ
jgi:hypothetical protein